MFFSFFKVQMVPNRKNHHLSDSESSFSKVIHAIVKPSTMNYFKKMIVIKYGTSSFLKSY